MPRPIPTNCTSVSRLEALRWGSGFADSRLSILQALNDLLGKTMFLGQQQDFLVLEISK